MRPDSQQPIVHYPVVESRDGWEVIDGEIMPESVIHDESLTLLRAVLEPWASARGAMVARNLAIRWEQLRPKIGVDPDVCILPSPPPRDGVDLRSVRTWLPGHAPPLFAIEVVSNTDPHKDYSIAPEKYAASGTGELVIFDPMLVGPRSHNGPWRLQVWRRDERGFGRFYQGEGPAYSTALGAYLVVRSQGTVLRIANDPDGLDLWPTPIEQLERERSAGETERAKLLARIAELESGDR
jgi:Uma2 family endonuclease